MGYKVKSKLNVDKKELLDAIMASKKQGKLTPAALQFLIEIANHAINRLPYNNPIDKEDCIQSALYDLMKYWKNFNPEISDNAFAFYTQMAKNGYAKVFNTIHRNKKLKTVKIFKPINLFTTMAEIHHTLKDYHDTYIKENTMDYDSDEYAIRSDVPDDLFESYFRYSKNRKKWSMWAKFSIDNMNEEFAEVFETDVYEHYFEFKFEFKTNIEFVSLDQIGDSEIFSV